MTAELEFSNTTNRNIESEAMQELRPHFEHIDAMAERHDEPFDATIALAGGIDAARKVNDYTKSHARIAQLRAVRENFQRAEEEMENGDIAELVKKELIDRTEALIEKEMKDTESDDVNGE